MPNTSLFEAALPPVDVQMEESWKLALADEFRKPYFHRLIDQVKAEVRSGQRVYPPGPQIFAAFAKTPLARVKVVILGQDPYHNPGEAMGLSFSVPPDKRIPPSLQNIYKELETDLGIERAKHGDLSHWAAQGVFLLNTILTVRERSPKSHHNFGWEHFTDAVIRKLSEDCSQLAFKLWGTAARAMRELINPNKHLIHEAAHPSPLARGAYFGSRHFSQANDYLKQHDKTPIDWQLPSHG